MTTPSRDAASESGGRRSSVARRSGQSSEQNTGLDSRRTETVGLAPAACPSTATEEPGACKASLEAGRGSIRKDGLTPGSDAATVDRSPLWKLLSREMDRQERKYGPFDNDIAGARLGLAVLQDELNEALQAWRDERRTDEWVEMHYEVMQLAAVACRLLMDTGLPEGSIAWKK